MNGVPDTRLSLIARLKDRADREAWAEFAALYRPVVVRVARRKGLQEADAEDLAQQVLAAVAAAVDRWDPAEERGKFRAWLGTIARNLILNALTRRPPDRAAGGEVADDPLGREPAPDGPDSALLRDEYRRELFHRAAMQVEAEFRPETWRAFWLTAVEGRDPAEVAELLGTTRGAVYAARGRVMRRLREKVLEWDDGWGDGWGDGE